ncbi:MAG: hypothetical protein ACKOWK_06285, partial [Micrococcales bacterium]
MFQAKSGSRIIATISAAAIAVVATLSLQSPASAATSYASTDTFLQNSFTNGQFVTGFTPGTPDYGFSIEALLQRKALGESNSQLAGPIEYLLTSPSVSGNTANPSGYLFKDTTLKLGLAGKWAFASALLTKRNITSRKAILTKAISKQLRNGDFASETGANTYDRAWLVLGLVANGFDKQAISLSRAMLRLQISDGGWDDGYTLGTSSPDGTGIVLQALAAVQKLKLSPVYKKRIAGAMNKAVTYLNGSLVGGTHYEAYGDANINGTEYAAMGLNAAGKSNSQV